MLNTQNFSYLDIFHAKMAEVNINHFDAQTHVYIAYSIKVKIFVLASDPAFAT